MNLNETIPLSYFEILGMHPETTINLKTIQVALFLLCLMGVNSLPAQPIHNIWAPPPKNGIAALVEDRIITFEELRREMAPLIGQVQAESTTPAVFEEKMNLLYLEVLRDLVDRILIVKAFEKEGYKIPQSYVDNEYERIMVEDFNNDRRKFLENLQKEGKTVQDFQRELKEHIIVSVMRGRMRKSQAEVSPEKIEKFYNQNKVYFFQEESVHLRLIMLKPYADESLDLLWQNADKVMAELKKKSDFAELAKKYSQDLRRERGGDWGWINRIDLRAELSEIAFSLKPGEYSKPLELGQQIFILYIEDKREEGIQPISEVRDRIENILAGQLAREAQKRWLERLRKDSYVKYY